MTVLYWGAVPVPWTASWTAEEGLFLAHCRWAGELALCQIEAAGQGKPMFGSPHAIRQRRAIADGLCDLCAKPLAARTKVSLSHARVRLDGARIGHPTVMQVEPLLHRECARISMEHCPSLKRDVRDGSLMVRQVTKYEVQVARMSPIYCKEMTGEARVAAGHAKVCLLQWRDRDEAWLEREAA